MFGMYVKPLDKGLQAFWLILRKVMLLIVSYTNGYVTDNQQSNVLHTETNETVIFPNSSIVDGDNSFICQNKNKNNGA